MLTEVALTPQVFDPDSNPDTEAWLGCLDALAHDFFPRNAASPVLGANLQNGGWIDEMRSMVGQIKDKKALWKVQALSQRLKDILVPRPIVNCRPDAEDGWAEEAIASHGAEPIGRILMTDGLHVGFHSGGANCHALQSVRDDSFWSGIQNTVQVPMKIGQQIALLRPLCLHSRYLALKLPYVHGSSDDETPFAAAVFGSAFRRSDGFSAVQAELHVTGDGLQGDSLTNTVHNIRSILEEELPAGSEVLLCFWPHFIDRKLLAGILTESGGSQVRAPRWGVGFQHVARPRDNRPDTGWWLIPHHNLAEFSTDFDTGSSSIIHQEPLRF